MKKGSTWNILVGRPEAKRSHRISRCRWEDNIKIDLKKTGCENMNWIHLAHDRAQVLTNTVMKFRIL
jgi:hypothetical protein